MKGILLAGGAGTRLYPMTVTTSKQLQPVYDKPLIYYPLSILMLGGINEILLISTAEDVPRFKELLGDGSQWGISLSYCIQDKPAGIAQAFILGEDFIGDETVMLILGDNIFHGSLRMQEHVEHFQSGAKVFGYYVNDPERYGVVEFDDSGKVLSIEEKPSEPRSNYAVPGMYMYDNTVVERSKSLKPSARGELEITDLNMLYLDDDELQVEVMGRGIAWLDTGTPESLLEAGNYIYTLQARQGLKVSCLEEIAALRGFISEDDLQKRIQEMPACEYRDYLISRFSR